MAVLSAIKCEACGLNTHVSHAPQAERPKVCHSCANKAAADRREADLAALAALPMEERIARIEAWIYDYRPYIPLSELRF